MSYNESSQAVFIMPYNPNFDHALHQVHGGLILEESPIWENAFLAAKWKLKQLRAG